MNERAERSAGEAGTSFNRREWASGYQNAAEFPEGYWLPANDRVPTGLEGTLFRNGPGLFQLGPDSVAHPFDGHGLVASLSFRGGAVFFRSRFVRTKAYCDETAAGRVLYPGAFGTRASGGWWRNVLQVAPRDPANTGLALWGGRLLALFEAGQPHRLCARDLSTAGTDCLGGSIRPGAPFSTGWGLLDRLLGLLLGWLGAGRHLAGGMRLGGEAVCAHPCHDSSARRLALFSCCFQLGLVAWSFALLGFAVTLRLPGLITRLSIREYDEEFREVSVTETRVPGYCFLHDMSVTAQHYIFFSNPVKLRMAPLLVGSRGPAQCIEWSGGRSRIYMVARPDQDMQPCTASRKFAGPGCQSRAAGAAAASLRARSDSAAELMPGARTKCSREDEGRPAESALTACSGKLPGVILAAADAGFVFHHAQAFESRDGQRITVDCVRYPVMPTFQQGRDLFVEWVDPCTQPISQLWRYAVDVPSGSVTCRRLCSRAAEFPTVNTDCTAREHRYVYASAALHPTANMPQQALLKLEVATGRQALWTRGEHVYVGEPVFVPSGGGREDAGWLLSVCYDAPVHDSLLVIVDAADMREVAALSLGCVLPHGLHGLWSSEYYGP